MSLEDFPRRFAQAFTAQDAAGLAALIAPDGTLQSLTGLWAESPEEIESAFAAEAAGIFARARLVTGKEAAGLFPEIMGLRLKSFAELLKILGADRSVSALRDKGTHEELIDAGAAAATKAAGSRSFVAHCRHSNAGGVVEWADRTRATHYDATTDDD